MGFQNLQRSQRFIVEMLKARVTSTSGSLFQLGDLLIGMIGVADFQNSIASIRLEVEYAVVGMPYDFIAAALDEPKRAEPCSITQKNA
jgi:hypothetical protein